MRVLLLACEGASPLELPGLLRQLRDAFVPHLQAKEELYEAVLRACREANDTTTLSLLGVFQVNLTVMANAVRAFLVSIEPEPTRLQLRFRAVSGSLRSMMEVEEKSVFPLFLRQSRLSFHPYSGAFPQVMTRTGEQS